jgi:N-acetylglucosaminyldiphosphoundecaprenol N-acetyl-beta-D-mannosaminyltransferase
VTQDQVVAWIAERARSGAPSHVVTANLDFAFRSWRDPEIHRIHFEADLVLADGMPLVWFSRLFGPPLGERVTGSDLVPRLAEAARDHGLSLFALGSAPGVAERALKVLQERYPGLRVAGWYSPPVSPLLQMDHESIVRRIRDARPDILLVAFGMPKQEKWIRLHRADWDVPVAIGVGGSLDFLAGAQTRAPRWVQRVGLEWVWRMALHPRRLIGRYALDLVFLAYMLLRLLAIRMSPVGSVYRGPCPDYRHLRSLGAVEMAFPPLRTPAEADRFHAQADPLARRGTLILDLSRAGWLSSLELGSLVRLARICRQAGHRLVVACAPHRAVRLIRLFRLDRYLIAPATVRRLEQDIRRLCALARHRAFRVRCAGPRLQILLPEEFQQDLVPQTRLEFLRLWRRGLIREVVVDASRMRFMDCTGCRFLDEVRQTVEKEIGRTVWYRGFPASFLKIMQRDGLQALRIDRRRRFRADGATWRRPRAAS